MQSWGVQSTLVEEDVEDQEDEEDQEDKEYRQYIDEAAKYIDKVFETSDNFITIKDVRRKSVELVNLTPPPPSSPDH